MFEFILALLTSVRVFFRSRSETALEILALRQQIVVLKRKRPRPRLNQFDRLFWIILRCVWTRWAEVLVAVKPETVVGWHRAGFRLFWKWQSRAPAGGPKTNAEIQALIHRLAEENATWGAPRIHGELQKLVFVVSERTVARYLQRVGRRGDSRKAWLTFLRNHRGDRSVRLLHHTHGDLPGFVLLLRHRARTPEDSALQRDRTRDCGVGRPTTAGGLSRSGLVSLRHPGP